MSNGSARRVVLITFSLFAAAASMRAQREPVEAKGIVLRSDGKAAVGARIGTGWWFDAERLSCYGTQHVWSSDSVEQTRGWKFVSTDGNGGFDVLVRPERTGKVQLTVFSEDADEAATFAWSKDADLSKLELKLEPVARLQATIVCSELGMREVPATAYLQSFDGRRLGRFHARSGKIDLLLPAGHHALYLYGASKQLLGRRTFQFPIAAGETMKERDIDVPANTMARYRGRRMPAWHADEARGINPQDANFERFRGKWLFVSIWRWNGSSPSRRFPQWIEFDKQWRAQHPGEEPPYAFVLLHSGGVKTLEELDQKIASKGIAKQHWNDAPLPFPVLLDVEGKTAKAWGLRWASETFLFDPDGKLWGEPRRAEELERIAAGLLKPAKPLPIHKK